MNFMSFFSLFIVLVSGFFSFRDHIANFSIKCILILRADDQAPALPCAAHSPNGSIVWTVGMVVVSGTGKICTITHKAFDQT